MRDAEGWTTHAKAVARAVEGEGGRHAKSRSNKPVGGKKAESASKERDTELAREVEEACPRTATLVGVPVARLLGRCCRECSLDEPHGQFATPGGRGPGIAPSPPSPADEAFTSQVHLAGSRSRASGAMNRLFRAPCPQARLKG